mmetsp:Transcript_109621/g.320847  ORF Transcript_109621/g.320847 Transcript_109621/m.320847 type:complete len:200 (-) Transcript_109621:1605-2204(-)
MHKDVWHWQRHEDARLGAGARRRQGLRGLGQRDRGVQHGPLPRELPVERLEALGVLQRLLRQRHARPDEGEGPGGAVRRLGLRGLLHAAGQLHGSALRCGLSVGPLERLARLLRDLRRRLDGAKPLGRGVRAEWGEAVRWLLKGAGELRRRRLPREVRVDGLGPLGRLLEDLRRGQDLARAAEGLGGVERRRGMCWIGC